MQNVWLALFAVSQFGIMSENGKFGKTIRAGLDDHTVVGVFDVCVLSGVGGSARC